MDRELPWGASAKKGEVFLGLLSAVGYPVGDVARAICLREKIHPVVVRDLIVVGVSDVCVGMRGRQGISRLPMENVEMVAAVNQVLKGAVRQGCLAIGFRDAVVREWGAWPCCSSVIREWGVWPCCSRGMPEWGAWPCCSKIQRE